jgi:hypothetical protein
MNLKVYDNPHNRGGGYSSEEIRRGDHWLNTDVTCPTCGKVQPVAATGGLGGPCVQCGNLTSHPAPQEDY